MLWKIKKFIKKTQFITLIILIKSRKLLIKLWSKYSDINKIIKIEPSDYNNDTIISNKLNVYKSTYQNIFKLITENDNNVYINKFVTGLTKILYEYIKIYTISEIDRFNSLFNRLCDGLADYCSSFIYKSANPAIMTQIQTQSLSKPFRLTYTCPITNTNGSLFRLAP